MITTTRRCGLVAARRASMGERVAGALGPPLAPAAGARPPVRSAVGCSPGVRPKNRSHTRPTIPTRAATDRRIWAGRRSRPWMIEAIMVPLGCALRVERSDVHRRQPSYLDHLMAETSGFASLPYDRFAIGP